MAGIVLLEALVRRRAQELLPGDHDAAERAVALAIHREAHGSSPLEAYCAASAFLRSWARHPSRQPALAAVS